MGSASRKRRARIEQEKQAKKEEERRLLQEKIRGSVRVKELKGKREQQRDKEKVEEAEAVRAEGMEVETPLMTGKCPKGHQLEHVGSADRKGKKGEVVLVCDLCEADLTEDARGCRDCWWHLCVECYEMKQWEEEERCGGCNGGDVVPPPVLEGVPNNNPAVAPSPKLAELPTSDSSSTPTTSSENTAATPTPVPQAADESQPARAPAVKALPAPISQFWDCPVYIDSPDTMFPKDCHRAVICTATPECYITPYTPSRGSFTLLSPRPFPDAVKRPILAVVGVKEKVVHLYARDLAGDSLPAPIYAPPSIATPPTDAVVYVRVKAPDAKQAKTVARQHLAVLKLPAAAFFDRADAVAAPAWDYDVGLRVPLPSLNAALRLSGKGFLVRTPKSVGDYGYVPAPAGTLKRAAEISFQLGELSLGVAHVGGYAIRCLREVEARVREQLAELKASVPPSFSLVLKGVAPDTSHPALDTFLAGMGILKTWVAREFTQMEGRRQYVVFVKSTTSPKANIGMLGNSLIRVYDHTEFPGLRPTTRRRPTPPNTTTTTAAVPKGASGLPPIKPKTPGPATPPAPGSYLGVAYNQNHRPPAPCPNADRGNMQGPAPTSTTHAAAATTTSEVELLKAALAETTERSRKQDEVIKSLQRTIDSLNATLASFMMRFSGQPAAAAPAPTASVASAAPPAAPHAAPATNEGLGYYYTLDPYQPAYGPQPHHHTQPPGNGSDTYL